MSAIQMSQELTSVKETYTIKKATVESKAKLRKALIAMLYSNDVEMYYTKMKKEELGTAEVSIDVNVDGITTTIRAQVETQENVIIAIDTQETSIVSMSEVGATATNNNFIDNQDNVIWPQNNGAVIKESVDVACKHNPSISIQVQGSQGTCGCGKEGMRMDTGT